MSDLKHNPSSPKINRSIREIEHGKLLAESEPDSIWGWGTPAGKKRAERRGRLIVSAANITEDPLPPYARWADLCSGLAG